MSVQPDDLGANFLSEATAQDNFESSTQAVPELSLMEGAPTDAAIPGSNRDASDSQWDATVNQTAQESRDEDDNADTIPMTPYREDQ